jgi:hypothetical protein
MKQPLTTDSEFLATDEGRAFARRMLTELSRPAQAGALPRTGNPVEDFETLQHEYIEHLEQHMREYRPLRDHERAELRQALSDMYRKRFNGLYPDDPEQLHQYLLQLTRLVAWLAALTCEVWIIETGERPSHYRGTEPGTVDLGTYHLEWAREAFGWWAAGHRRLPYLLKIEPRRRPGTFVSELAALVQDDPELRAALESFRKPVEIEDGCPLC